MARAHPYSAWAGAGRNPASFDCPERPADRLTSDGANHPFHEHIGRSSFPRYYRHFPGWSERPDCPIGGAGVSVTCPRQTRLPATNRRPRFPDAGRCRRPDRRAHPLTSANMYAGRRTAGSAAKSPTALGFLGRDRCGQIWGFGIFVIWVYLRCMLVKQRSRFMIPRLPPNASPEERQYRGFQVHSPAAKKL
jgi:hypothetical protein